MACLIDSEQSRDGNHKRINDFGKNSHGSSYDKYVHAKAKREVHRYTGPRPYPRRFVSRTGINIRGSKVNVGSINKNCSQTVINDTSEWYGLKLQVNGLKLLKDLNADSLKQNHNLESHSNSPTELDKNYSINSSSDDGSTLIAECLMEEQNGPGEQDSSKDSCKGLLTLNKCEQSDPLDASKSDILKKPNWIYASNYAENGGIIKQQDVDQDTYDSERKNKAKYNESVSKKMAVAEKKSSKSGEYFAKFRRCNVYDTINHNGRAIHIHKHMDHSIGHKESEAAYLSDLVTPVNRGNFINSMGFDKRLMKSIDKFSRQTTFSVSSSYQLPAPTTHNGSRAFSRSSMLGRNLPTESFYARTYQPLTVTPNAHQFDHI